MGWPRLQARKMEQEPHADALVQIICGIVRSKNLHICIMLEHSVVMSPELQLVSISNRVGSNRVEKMAHAPFPPCPGMPFAGGNSGTPFFSSSDYFFSMA